MKVPRVLPRMIRMPAKVSGGKTLFVGAHTERIVGMDEAESAALIAELSSIR